MFKLTNGVLTFSNGSLHLGAFGSYTIYEVIFDFGTVSSSGNINSITSETVGEKVSDAIDGNGDATGISFTINDEFQGQSDNGGDFPGGNPWGIPTSVARDCFFSNSVTPADITIAGLVEGQAYQIGFASYRSGSGDFSTEFLIDGNSYIVASRGAGAPEDPVEHLFTAPASGNLSIQVKRPDGDTNAAYVNAMRIRWAVPDSKGKSLFKIFGTKSIGNVITGNIIRPIR